MGSDRSAARPRTPSTAEFNTPASVSPTLDGGVLVADQDNGVIREITIPPVTSIALSPASPTGSNGWYVSPVTVSVSTTENSTISCELDPSAAPVAYGAIPAGCAGVGAISANGSHTFWAASQNAFDDSDSPASVTVKIDIGQPKITCPEGVTFPYGTSGATVSATAVGRCFRPLVGSAHEAGAGVAPRNAVCEIHG